MILSWPFGSGRRFVVACKNQPGVVDPRALSCRERDVAGYLALGCADKLIGYHLGLSPSAVSNHVASMKRKLSVRSRTQLVALLRRFEPAPPAV